MEASAASVQERAAVSVRPVARRTSREQQREKEALRKELAKLQQQLENANQVLARRAKVQQLEQEQAQAEAYAIACAEAVARFENMFATVQPFTSHSHALWEVTQAEKKDHAAKLAILGQERAHLEAARIEAARERLLLQGIITETLESDKAEEHHHQSQLKQRLAVLDRQAACDQATMRICSAAWSQSAVRWLVRMWGPDSNYTVASQLSNLCYLWLPRLLPQQQPAAPSPPVPALLPSAPDADAAAAAADAADGSSTLL